MKQIWTLLLVTALSLASCIRISQEDAPAAPALFVTASLPPTKLGLSLPTDTATYTPDTSLVSLQTTGTLASSCQGSAILVQDVTIPDNTNLPAGQKFTKTWRFQNTGKCAWTGYTMAFVSGDRMNAPDSVAVPETAARATVDVSVDLVAPANDGAFTGVFELRNADGKAVPIGTERSFWVKIVVGSPPATPGFSDPAVPSHPVDIAHCRYSENPGYVQQLIDLINQARAEAQLPTLTVNAQLSAAAQAHSLDMACGNFLSHFGSDGSYISDRINAAGHPGSGAEIIAIGTPQDAIRQWRDDPGHWEFVLNPYFTEIGVGYAYCASSDFGGYFTVDF